MAIERKSDLLQEELGSDQFLYQKITRTKKALRKSGLL
jgi:hypothetical protein